MPVFGEEVEKEKQVIDNDIESNMEAPLEEKGADFGARENELENNKERPMIQL